MAATISPLAGVIVAGGFTVLGVALKIAYDAWVARRQSAKERIERFAPERRAAYENFLRLARAELDYMKRIRDLGDAHHRGETVDQEVIDNFPASPMSDFANSLDEVRRLAHTIAVISAADAIMGIFRDMIAANKNALNDPDGNDEILWFLLQRMFEDREREFIYGYRLDLGIGPPAGGAKDYPIPRRPWKSPDLPEQIIRLHLAPRKPRPPKDPRHHT
jgi:hypothetical protein